MSIRFLTKQEPSSFTEGTQSTTTSPWIRLDIKQEVSEFSYIPVPPPPPSHPPPVPPRREEPELLPLFQRPKRARITRPPPPISINSFEDALEAIRSGRASSVSSTRTPILKPKSHVILSRPPPQALRQSFDDDEIPLDRLLPSSSRSSSRSDDPSRSSSVELGSGKKYSLAGLTNNEVKERKKEQNILAARRYRQRRNELLNEKKQEIEKLEQRKNELQILEASLAGQIQALKDLFAEQLKQRVGGGIPIFDSKEEDKQCAAVQASVVDNDDSTVEDESNLAVENFEASVAKVESESTVDEEKESGEEMIAENSESPEIVDEEMEEYGNNQGVEECEVTEDFEVKESEDQSAESEIDNEVVEKEMEESEIVEIGEENAEA